MGPPPKGLDGKIADLHAGRGQRWQAALRRRGEAGRVPVPAAGQQAAGGPSSPRAETPVPAENS